MSERKISVFINACAWNRLFACKINLAEAFPPDKYCLFITREVEIELHEIPDISKNGMDNRELKAYIADGIAMHDVKTFSIFGFASVEPDGSLSKNQVYGGFDQGIWQSDADRQWYASPEAKALIQGKPVKKSGLSKHQADASLAVRSFDSIVLTGESKIRNSPLVVAAGQGGKVVRFTEVKQSGLTLKDYIARLSI